MNRIKLLPGQDFPPSLLNACPFGVLPLVKLLSSLYFHSIFTLFPQYYYRLNMCGGHEVCTAHVNVTGTSRQKAPLVKTVISGQITPAATRSEMLAVNSW